MRDGLLGEPKELGALWLYDERGSRLYEEVTRLPEYYLPRREAEILQTHSADIADTGARTLIELGSGSTGNTRLLLDALAGTLERFVPVDVSEDSLRDGATALAADYPGLSIEPVTGNFERGLDSLPPGLVAFLGSTIGNLYPEARARFFARIRSPLLLSLDLVKDPSRLEAAYDDPAGVTERFARNALDHANRALGANFDQAKLEYEARWDPEHEWMDIGFRARAAPDCRYLRARPRSPPRGRRVAADRGQLQVPARTHRIGAGRGRPATRRLVDRLVRRLRGR